MNGSILNNRKFLYIWASQILSQFTINIMNFIVLVHLFEQTGSSVAASLIWVAYGIPAIILGPFAAAAVDIYDRKRVLFISNLFQGIVVLGYAFLFQKYLYLSYGVVLGYSLMDQFYVPAETASLSTVVDKDQLPQANSLFFISQQAAAILGFGMAGIILELIGFRNAIFLGSIMLFLAAFVVSWLPSIRAGRMKMAKSMDEKAVRFFERIREGYLFIRHNKVILYPFLFLMWMQVSLAILVVNLPAIGIQIVGTKPSLAGVLTVGPGGIGALVGTILVNKVLAQKVRKKKIVELALLVISVTFLIVSIFVPHMWFWLSRLVLVLCFFAVGIAYVSALIPTLTYLQVNTPRKLMGRVFGNFWFLTTVITIFPVLFSATITDILGVNFLLATVGLVAAFMLIISKIYLKKTFNSVREGGYVDEFQV